MPSSPILPRVIALALGGLDDPAIVVAALRAGALGVLDLGSDFRASVAVQAASRIAKICDRPFGLRLPCQEIQAPLLRGINPGLSVLIGTEFDGFDWKKASTEAETLGRTLIAEVTSRESARLAVEAGVSALIVSGNEAGGLVGEESAFVLLQSVLALGPIPRVWVRGGIGPRSAAACLAMGAAGVVLDGALLLARESPISTAIRDRVGQLDGGETHLLGGGTGLLHRMHIPPGSDLLTRLRLAAEVGGEAWLDALRSLVGWSPDLAWPIGQDSAFASGLARRFVTVGGIVQAVDRAMSEGPEIARSILSSGSPMARSHGTAYPIVQGPMTRVSDRPAFALAVAEAGALPMLALALSRGPDVRTLLESTRQSLGGRPWGVGILGFVPADLRREQLDAIREVRPPFALIAGGRPDQAKALESDGIATYLHVPSARLLRQYLDEGARRFVLEGRECGGHVGPRSSFVLWEQAVEVLSRTGLSDADRGSIHVLFAGGIHDRRSAAAVATLAAPIAAIGIKVGLLMGTAYLFTEQAVVTGAVVPGFQAEAVACERTVLLETGPGHEVRVSPTPFAADFERVRSRLLAEKRPADEIRETLEALNTGRLRLAAKGVERGDYAGSPLVAVSGEEQNLRGVYMLGQVASLKNRISTIAELHREVIEEGAILNRSVEIDPRPVKNPLPSDIAIVGMAALMPGAANVREFWKNTLSGVDAITEIPADHWDWSLYYDADPAAPDKIVSKWGGFVPEIPFDPLRYGMPPASLPSIEPMQLLILEVVRSALEDAGYSDRPFPRDRTAVVLGAGGGAAQLAMGYALRSYLPMVDAASPDPGPSAMDAAAGLLPEWTEDSFPGILLNVAAGRVANRFDLGGANYTVDAACGSSLAAASMAVRELESGAADMVILGGADTVQNPFTYLAFSKTHAFSPRGRCRPFDASADGIVISEGVAAVVLKRLADAERDGDRIYSVIKGIGASSDGRGLGLTAPRPEGQVSALRRAYEKAGISPSTVGYVEAHGTGTAAGDLAEVSALTEVFTAEGSAPNSCSIGSVKSSIGHTKCAAGLAGLINASLSLHHGVFPPTIGVSMPNPRADLASGPFTISTTTRPWLRESSGAPRRAGVSAFGFGGTNFHAVLEAYTGSTAPLAPPLEDWPAELFVWRAESRTRIDQEVERLLEALREESTASVKDLAYALYVGMSAYRASQDGVTLTLSLVAASKDDLREKLEEARRVLARSDEDVSNPRGIYFQKNRGPFSGKLAFLFPGQGAQRAEMLLDLALAFSEIRSGFEDVDQALRSKGRSPIGPLIFDPPEFDENSRDTRRLRLISPELAQPSLAAACLGATRLLSSLGIEPDLFAGHSFGEVIALQAAGGFSVETLAELANGRGRVILSAAGENPGAMAAIAVGPDGIRAILDGEDDIAAVNWNGPRQTVVAGGIDTVDRVVRLCKARSIPAQRLPVACAFHSSRMGPARAPLASLAISLGLKSPEKPVYSNVTAKPYPSDPSRIAAQVGDQVAKPVRFAEMIEAMHLDGATIFVEVGPGNTLSPLVDSILGDQPHLSVSLDPGGRSGIEGMLRTLARLAAAGVPIRLDRLFHGRSPRRLDPETFRLDPPDEVRSPSTWLVNGSRSRPVDGPEPVRLEVASRGISGEPRPSNGHPKANGAVRPRKGFVEVGFPPAILGSSEVSRDFESFQETMRSFLDVQKSTMLGYLGSRASERASRSIIETPARTGNGQHTSAVKVFEPSMAVIPFDSSKITGKTTRENAPTTTSEPTLRPDREAISAKLLKIVQGRTGYPVEMIKFDVDLEADLGIDSIKRVEIIGSLREAFPGLAIGSDPDRMEKLSRSRTLAAVVDLLATRPEVVPEPSIPDRPKPDRNEVAIRRLLLESVAAPLPRLRAKLAIGGVVLLTDDGRGIGRAVAADLRALGHRVVRVRHGVSEGEVEGLNFGSEAAIEALLDRVRSQGPLTAIVHLLPLRETTAAGLDPEAWGSRMNPEVRGLFLMAKASADDLASSARLGGSALIAATSMGGSFASNGGQIDFFPGHGGVAGLVKTLAREWPGVRARVIDFDLAATIEVIAADLVRELLGDDSRAEVGYSAGDRIAIRSRPAPLSDFDVIPAFTIQPGEPILITGGARGISASVAGDLARRWKPTLLLLGGSPPPPDRERAETEGEVEPSALKAAIARRLGAGAVAADVEKAYQTLRREREIRVNLRALTEAGATVRYARGDVRDRSRLGPIVDSWRRQFGPPVGLIHGAGVIHDKLLREKSIESFDRVLGAKVGGILNVLNLLDLDSLRFSAFFSSIAGRFGNKGQADYAAANEILNKLALWLDRRTSARVVSLIWGPWKQVGMVSDLEGHLGREGLGLIAPEQGRERLADELTRGKKGDVEVMIASDLGPFEDSETPVTKAKVG